MSAGIVSHSNYENNITIEFTFKPFQKMYNTYVFAGLAIYGYSNHETNITIEFALKNCSRRCIALVCLPVLPYMVTPIIQQISPLNSH